ncbi:MAG: penicillin-binding protein [Clostridia bacterium]|nr:penicillin-binding protein [Clostridia bacterium]
MRTTARRSIAILVLVAMVVSGLGWLASRFVVNGEKWATMRANEHLNEDGSFIAAGNVTDRNGELLAYTKGEDRVYSESERIRRATLHIVGDTEGYIASGVQTAYKTKLTGYNPITGLYSLKKYGRGNDVRLTIDAEICAKAYDMLKGRNGVVAAYNYETGELICSVSSPNYDINNKPTEEEINSDESGKYEGLYLNRLIDGMYTPGSTFKIITTTCAIENDPDIYSFTYKCTGETSIDGVKVTCPSVHGEMDFKECLANSCNCAYAQIASDLGKDKLTATANEYGFGQQFEFGNQQTNPSVFDLNGASDGDIAWAGVGQYTTLVNPYHMLTVVGSIANGGEAVLPYVVSEVVTPAERVVMQNKAKTATYLTPETASAVDEMLRFVVEEGYGDGRFDGLSMCGKTGTAEVEDGKKPHSWFMGYSQNPKCPVAIVVIVENGGWGAENALPIASGVMSEIYKTMA